MEIKSGETLNLMMDLTVVDAGGFSSQIHFFFDYDGQFVEKRVFDVEGTAK